MATDNPFRYNPAILRPNLCFPQHRTIASFDLGTDPFLYHPAILGPNLNVLQPNDQLFSASCTYKYFSFSLLSFLSSFIFTLQVQRRRIGKQKRLTLHIPFVNLMYCRLLIYILEGILFALRRLHLDVAAFPGRGSPCIMGGARTFGWQGFPHGEKFFSCLLAFAQK